MDEKKQRQGPEIIVAEVKKEGVSSIGDLWPGLRPVLARMLAQTILKTRKNKKVEGNQ